MSALAWVTQRSAGSSCRLYVCFLLLLYFQSLSNLDSSYYITTQLESELGNYYVAAQHINHYAIKASPEKTDNIDECTSFTSLLWKYFKATVQYFSNKVIETPLVKN